MTETRGSLAEAGQKESAGFEIFFVWPGCMPTLLSNENSRNVLLPKRACVRVLLG